MNNLRSVKAPGRGWSNRGWRVGRAAVALMCGGLAAGAGATAGVGDVTGHVTLSDGKPAKNAVVWLNGAEKSKPLKSAMVDQRDLAFIPHMSVVTLGTTVRFPNDDTVYHNVFAEFDAKRFDLGMYPRGTTKSIKFDKTGMVALMCSVHSEMGAYIMVVDTPYYAVVGPRGTFRISNVPPGSYELHVWHESGQTTIRAVTVGGEDPAWNLRTSRG